VYRLDANVGFILDMLDEVLRHALLESGSPHEHNHFGSIACMENGSLSSGVAAPDDENALTRHGYAVKARRAINESAAEQSIVTFKLTATPGSARGEWKNVCADAVSAVQDDAMIEVERLDSLDLANE
jgi:hypothetical protein